MHLMAIDGNSLVNRVFYGVRPLSAAEILEAQKADMAEGTDEEG